MKSENLKKKSLEMKIEDLKIIVRQIKQRFVSKVQTKVIWILLEQEILVSHTLYKKLLFLYDILYIPTPPLLVMYNVHD